MVLWIYSTNLYLRGYSAVSLFNLKARDLIISGIISILSFTVIVEYPLKIIGCTILQNTAQWCSWYSFSLDWSVPFWILGLFGVTIGWSFGITFHKTKPEEKPAKKPVKRK